MIKSEDHVDSSSSNLMYHRNQSSNIMPTSSIIQPMQPMLSASNAEILENANHLDEKPPNHLIYHSNIMEHISQNDDKPSPSYLIRCINSSSPNHHHNSIMSPLNGGVPKLHNSIITTSPIRNSMTQLNSSINSLSMTGLSTSTPHISSVTASIKYCNSSPTVDTSHNASNLSPTSSTSTTVGSNSNVQMSNIGGSMDISYNSNASNSPMQKSSSSHHQHHHLDSQLSTPDTTKKSSGGRRAEKPPLSYINMIAMAIRDSPQKKLTLSEIYNYLQKKWVKIWHAMEMMTIACDTDFIHSSMIFEKLNSSLLMTDFSYP